MKMKNIPGSIQQMCPYCICIYHVDNQLVVI